MTFSLRIRGEAPSQRPITGYQVFCKVSLSVLFSGFVTGALLAILTQAALAKIPRRFPQFEDWGTPLMRLQKVVHRHPVPFLRHPEREDCADYLGVYCVETLECGHRVHTFPEADALTAVRRECKDCKSSNLIEFPAAKKPAEKKAA